MAGTATWRGWCWSLIPALLTGAGCPSSASSSGGCEVSRVVGDGFALARCPVPEITVNRGCGPGCRQLTRVGTVSTNPSLSCATRRAFWWVAEERLFRVSLPTGAVTSVLGPFRGEHTVIPTGLACDGGDVVVTAMYREHGGDRLDLVARFGEEARRAAVLWSDRAIRSDDAPARWPTFSAGLVAWARDFTVPTLWAMVGREPPRAVRRDFHPATAPAASSRALIFASGGRLHRWLPGGAAPARLYDGVGEQWSPAAADAAVVWIDQRDEPRGTERNPRNPQVYLLRDGERQATRLSRGARRGWRGEVSVSERWVVWVDTRNDPAPDRAPGAWVRAEVWGVRLGGGDERPLAADVVASLPRVVGDTLYYVASSEGSRRDLFARPLPRE